MSQSSSRRLWLAWLQVGLAFVLIHALVLGFATHALFNIPFALAVGIPLWRLKSPGGHLMNES